MNSRNKLTKYIISLAFCVVSFVDIVTFPRFSQIAQMRRGTPFDFIFRSLRSRYVARHGTNLWGIGSKSGHE